MDRRTVVRLLGAGFAGGLGGCNATEFATSPTPTSGDVTPVPEETPSLTPTPHRPEECPTTQGLGVEWPDRLTASTVLEFVLAYEERYYRETRVSYPFDPDTPVDFLDLRVSPAGGVSDWDGGYLVSVSVSGAVYTPGLTLRANKTSVPSEIEPIPSTQIGDQQVTALLAAAAQNPDERPELQIRANNRTAVDRYARLINEFLPPEERLTGPRDDATLYFHVNTTGVRLDVEAGTFHGDLGSRAWYYVDNNVVRRTTDRDTDPTEGELQECRTPP